MTAAALDCISEGFVVLDREWRFVFANPAAERFMQKSAADVLGRTLWECFPDAASRRFGAEYRRAVAEGVQVDFEEYYPEPLNAWFEVRAYPSAEGLSIVFRDVTTRRRTEDALRINLAKFSALFESFPLGISVTDADGRVREVNAAASRLLGTTPAAVLSHRVGTPQWRIIRPDGSTMPPAEFASVRAMKEARVVEDVETGIARPGEDVIWVSVSAAPIPLDGYGVVITYGDIARRRRAEADLAAAHAALQAINATLEARVAERTAELTERTAQLKALALDRSRAEERERQRIAGVLHDHLQQLLVLARINLDVALGEPGAAGDRNLSTLRDLLVASLEITRRLTAELSPAILHRTDLATALRWLGRWFEGQCGLKVDVDGEEHVRAEEEIRVALFRATRELLFNVVKHAGVLHAAVTVDRDADGRVRVVVRDRGVGFDPEHAREDSGATGSVGLLSLRHHLELLGGRLEIESAPGRGATITILGPVSPQPSDAGDRPPSAALPAREGVKPADPVPASPDESGPAQLYTRS